MKKILLPIILALSIIPASAETEKKPNVIFILVDDMGYSDIGCYGGEIDTPNIDALAETGLRFTQMYNTGKCMSSRACLLTGIYSQQSEMSIKPLDMKHSVTLAEVLRPMGYHTLASGKHHGTENLFDRGFDHYYGLRDGCANLWNPGVKREGEPEPGRKGPVRAWCDDAKTQSPYTPESLAFYTTDAFTDKPLQWLNDKTLDEKPFLLYLAYTAPHYPLHAKPEDIAKYKGKYDEGYAATQKARYQRMIDQGIIAPTKTTFTPLKESSWSKLAPDEMAKERRRMEIYAAMLDSVDQNIGKIVEKLKEQGKLENTLIMFASDNGGCAELTHAKVNSKKIEDFGNVASYETVGKNWATVQNTPLRNWKNYSHEGGIRTPFIINFPGKIKTPGGLYHEAAHFIDIMATLVDLTGARYPETFQKKDITPMQGVSLLPALGNMTLAREKLLFWQFRHGGAVRDGSWKAVFYNKKWELFDLSKDHNEAHDLSSEYPEKMTTMKQLYTEWYSDVTKTK